MRVMLIGDVVGKPGRQIVVKSVPVMRRRFELDLVIANAENAAGGSGLTPEIYNELIAAQVDGITLGDHIYRRREIISVLESQSNIVKPANYPRQAAGRESMVLTTPSGNRVGVISLMGRVFMRPVDCPWTAVDRVLQAMPDRLNGVVVDFHAEATSDKQLMGRYLDGRVAAVLGTHTHVTTADEQILPGGTAFQCDIGMTGAHNSILGRRVDRVLETTLSFHPTHFDVATKDVRLSATVVTINATTGQATSIERLAVTPTMVQRWHQDRS